MIPSKPHVALLASPGLGHLIPVVELAKRLVAQHGFTITVFAVTMDANNRAENELLRAATSTWPTKFNTVVLPNISAQLEPNAAILTRLLAMVSGALPFLRSSIAHMEIKPVAMIVDLFGTEAIKIAEEFNMVRYVLIASNARFLAYASYLPYVEKEVNRDEPFYIPGCEPVPGEDLLDLTFPPNDRAHQEFLRIGHDMTTVDGILVNTWEHLEAKTLRSFREDSLMKPFVKVPVHSVGPLVRTDGPVGSKTKLSEWLDSQPDESVIYISFGSGGTISTQQTLELAWGLEMSRQRFVWMVRPPIENDTAASLFKHDHHDVDEMISRYLPDGFLDRTRKVGMVVPMWAPQEEILSHRSIGGFISHCGWNSVLESIVNGVPIITWPLYAEQSMNATMLTQELKIAVRSVLKPSKELVKREEIGNLVRRIMVDKEGKGMRMRVKDLQRSANKALSMDGSSYGALSKVAKECEMKLLKIHSNVI